ncbi:LrgB family protein [Halobacillus sp. Marseille-Q1614]|uniref:LrgB family protein n=1 Tax=Halobacillus sp. Marseille-Q1614 TaxID=2709134 RepID=UPI0020C46A8D|nr:LrgB family protein [Halobacillus sp. Marseille-Q1614]
MVAILMFAVTIVVFLLMSRLYTRFHNPLLAPVLTSTLLIVLMLVIFQIPYETYMKGGRWIDTFLGPAVVALAYPMYKQRKEILTYLLPVLSGVLAGLVTALGTGLLFAKAFGIDRIQILSMVPKSLTTPVAIPVSTEIGGIPSMTVVFTMVAGFTGLIAGPLLLKWTRMTSAMGQGIAFGSASHALGTSKALEYGEETASMSSVAMSLTAIFGSVLGPLFVWIFQI